MNSPLPGSELTKEPFRWDQRLFALVLRLPGAASAEPEQLGSVPTDESAITQMCEVTGGNCMLFCFASHLAFFPLIHLHLCFVCLNDSVSVGMHVVLSWISVAQENFKIKQYSYFSSRCESIFKMQWEVLEYFFGYSGCWLCSS